MTTKERITDEALTLFSIKGFKGTSVKNIADAVGIKDSSLYKHFKSKQEIFDTIVLDMGKRMESLGKQIGLPDEADFINAAEFYGELTLEGLQQISERAFLFYLEDDYISRFWRMGNMEQYQNPEIYSIFRKIFMEDSITYQTMLFSLMMEKGVFYEAPPKVVAMNFYTPIFFLLSKYSGRANDETARAEALETLQEQIGEFYRIYRKK